MADSQSFLVTVPIDWELEKYAVEKRKFSGVQDYVREIIRRDIEIYDKEQKEQKNGKK